MNNLLAGERIDDLHIKGYRIIQREDGFCFGMDAVLLSDFAKAKQGAKVLDVGTGTGIIPILMEAKEKGNDFTGLEIQQSVADMALRSVSLNGLNQNIKIIVGDIKEAASLFSPSSFDVVTSNPPYMNDNHGLKSDNESVAISRHEILCSLEDIIAQSSRLLKPGGSFFMVHKPFRLAEIINTFMKYKLEPKRLRLVHPYLDKEPNMVLIEAVRGGKSMIKIEPPLIVYEKPGVYTKEIYQIYGYE